MKACILGLGQWIPDMVRSNSDWPAEFTRARPLQTDDRILVDIAAGDSDDLCDRIVARYLRQEVGDPFLGTRERRIADATMTSRRAEALAAERALADAGVGAGDLDMVVSWTMKPDRISPASASWVAHAIGAERAFAVGMDAACASAIIQMNYAAAMLESGRAETVLLTQSHLGSRIFPDLHPASPNLGDAATAIVMGLGQRREFVRAHAVTEGRFCDAVTWTRGREEDAPWYEPGGRFVVGSKEPGQARRLVKDAVRIGARTIRELLQPLDTPIADIAALISVQPWGWVPGAIAEAVGLGPESAPQTFSELAHIGACGTAANLIAARERGLLRPGSLVALYAQGAGFVRAGALLRW